MLSIEAAPGVITTQLTLRRHTDIFVKDVALFRSVII